MKRFLPLFVLVVFSGCLNRQGPSIVEQFCLMGVSSDDSGMEYRPLPMEAGLVPGLLAYQYDIESQQLTTLFRIDWFCYRSEVNPATIATLVDEMYRGRIIDSLIDSETGQIRGDAEDYFADGSADRRLNWLVNESLLARRIEASVRIRIVGAELWNTGEINDWPVWTWADEK